MTQYIYPVPAIRNCHYLFTVILDHAPEPGEAENIEASIQAAMNKLDVPAEQVGVPVYKSMLPPQTPAEQRPTMGADSFPAGACYLIVVMVRTEEGGFTEDPEDVSARAIRGFSRFSGLPEQNIAAMVLENAHLEVDWNTRDTTPEYDERKGPARLLIERLNR